MNVAILVGRLTKDVELQYLPTGTAVATGALATNRQVKKGENWETAADFHNFKLFGKKAEYLQNYSQKGSRVSIRGGLRTDKWTDQQGNNRYNHYIYVEEVEILSSKDNNQNNNNYNANQSNSNYNANQSNSNYNANQNSSNYNANQNAVPEIDVDDEDIPF